MVEEHELLKECKEGLEKQAWSNQQATAAGDTQPVCQSPPTHCFRAVSNITMDFKGLSQKEEKDRKRRKQRLYMDCKA